MRQKPLTLKLTTFFQRWKIQIAQTTQTAGKPINHRSFLGRINPAARARVPTIRSHIEVGTKERRAREERARRYLDAFGGDPGDMLATMAATCRPSTTRTYAAMIATIAPATKPTARKYEHWARKAMKTEWGRPAGAETFAVEDFRALLGRLPVDMAAVLRLMWATASRAADLSHFKSTIVQGHWRIELGTRQADSRWDLRAPKSDPRSTRDLLKWAPVRPDFPTPIGPFPSWSEIDVAMKQLSTTPHAIRRTAIQFLEKKGFTTAEIATLTNHSPSAAAPGAAPYLAKVPTDPAAKTCARLVTTLLNALSPTPTVTEAL